MKKVFSFVVGLLLCGASFAHDRGWSTEVLDHIFAPNVGRYAETGVGSFEVITKNEDEWLEAWFEQTGGWPMGNSDFDEFPDKDITAVMVIRDLPGRSLFLEILKEDEESVTLRCNITFAPPQIRAHYVRPMAAMLLDTGGREVYLHGC